MRPVKRELFTRKSSFSNNCCSREYEYVKEICSLPRNLRSLGWSEVSADEMKQIWRKIKQAGLNKKRKFISEEGRWWVQAFSDSAFRSFCIDTVKVTDESIQIDESVVNEYETLWFIDGIIHLFLYFVN